MLLTCPKCGDSNELPAARLPPSGARGSCGRCGQLAVFDGSRLVRPDSEDDEATPANPLQALSQSDDATPPHPLDAAAVAEERAAAGHEWYVSTAAGRQGPMDLAALKALIREERLSGRDHVYGPGQSDWIPAGEREELRRYFAIKAKAPGAGAAAAAGADFGAASAGPDARDPFAWCTRHPTLEATWICHGCHLSWCRTCPAEKNLPGGKLRTCPQCERPVAERQKLKPITPWWTEMPKMWRFPIQGRAWLAILVLCGFWAAQLFSSVVPGYGQAAYYILSAGVLSYYLLVIRTVGEGGRRLPDLGKVESWKDELFWPGIKGLVVTALVLLPLNLYSQMILAPAIVEHAGAVAVEELLTKEGAPTGSGGEDEAGGGEDLADESPGADETWAWHDSAPTASLQRELFIDAMRQTGATEEEIEQVLADMEAADGEEGEDGEAWAPQPRGFAPMEAERPSGALLFVKLLGVVALAGYALVVWPLLMIIVAMFNTIAPAFNPPLILRIAKEVWPEYKRLLLFLAPVLIFSFPVRIIATTKIFERMVLSLLGVPGILSIICVPLSIYLTLVMMNAIGRTAELIDRKIDWF